MVATLTHRMEALRSAAGRLFGGGGNGKAQKAPAQAPDAAVRGGQLARTSTSASAAAAASDPAVAEAAPTKKAAWVAPQPAANVLPLPSGAGGVAAAAARSSDPTVHEDLGFPRGLTDRYDLGQLLGAGGSGVVRVAVDKRTGKRWACKTIPKVNGGERAERFFVCSRRIVWGWPDAPRSSRGPRSCILASGLSFERGYRWFGGLTPPARERRRWRASVGGARSLPRQRGTSFSHTPLRPTPRTLSLPPESMHRSRPYTHGAGEAALVGTAARPGCI
jgi:hypothetical protein